LHAAATASIGVIWRGPGGDRLGTGVAQKTDDEQRQEKLFMLGELKLHKNANYGIGPEAKGSTTNPSR